MLSSKKQKKLKKRLAKGGGTAEEALAIYGQDACASIALLDSPAPPLAQSLTLAEVQNVLLWALTSDAGTMPRWIAVGNKPLIRSAIVIVVPSLSCAASTIP